MPYDATIYTEDKGHYAVDEKKKVRPLDDASTEQWRRWYRHWRKITAHPNLKIDFFGVIDTKIKAYWLGFLYADGSLTRNTGGTVYITIELNTKDEERIDLFCENLRLNKEKKKYRIRNGTQDVMINFACKAMSRDLMRQGLMFCKSKILRYPILPDRQTELAFLLGYYDGDGQQNTTRIISGSSQFLREIKNRFALPFNIHRYTSDKEIRDRKTKGTKFVMSLGAELFCEMMENYEPSMSRKRWFPCTKEEAARRTREALTSERIRKRKKRQARWRAITPSQLQKLVREEPINSIATKYNVHYKTVTEKCDKMRIVRPPKNYWQERRALGTRAKS